MLVSQPRLFYYIITSRDRRKLTLLLCYNFSLFHSLSLPKGYGIHLGFRDDEYEDLGVNLSDNEKELINSADIIIQLGLPEDEKLSLLKEKQTIITKFFIPFKIYGITIMSADCIK